jgi:hypothetical protein
MDTAEPNLIEAKYPQGEIIENPVTGRKCALTINFFFTCDADNVWTLPEEGQPGIAPKPSKFDAIFTEDDTCQVISSNIFITNN